MCSPRSCLKSGRRQKIALDNPEMQARLKARGITDVENLFCAPASQGYFGTPEGKGGGFKVYCLDSRNVGNNYYGSDRGAVRRCGCGQARYESPRFRGVSTENLNFSESDVSPLSPALKPVLQSQPKGVNFRMDGHVVEWQKWRFHIDRRVRCFPMSSTTTTDGRAPFCIRATCPRWSSPTTIRTLAGRTYFDVGEYGLGLLASPLVSGVDCPDTATFVSTTIGDDEGNPLEVPNTICVFGVAARRVSERDI